ncbi:MAG: hypothetical protein WC894_06110 [Patescibacteria group bacterium]
MLETVAPPTQPKPEKPTKVATFEHLFTGVKWNSLPALNPLNVPVLTIKFLAEDSLRDERFGESVKAGMGFAERIEIPFPDKLGMAYEMLQVIPINERFSRGKISDLLKQEERLGGVGLREVYWKKEEAKTIGGIIALAESDVEFEDSAEAKVIGVLGENNQPTALILFRDGRRPEKKVKETVKIGVKTSAVSSVPVSI